MRLNPVCIGNLDASGSAACVAREILAQATRSYGQSVSSS